jgi:outer membrane protein
MKTAAALLFILVVVLGSCCRAHAEDLVTVYQQSAATSPILARSRALLDADRFSRPMAEAGLKPKLGAAAGVSANNAEISGFGTDFGLPISTDLNKDYMGANYSVTLTQPLLNGQAWVAVRAADAQIRAGQAAALAAEQDLILQVTQAYFDVLRAEANVRVAVGQKELLKSVFDQTEASLRVGSGDIIAVREAGAQLDAAEAARIGADNEARITRQRLARLTHQPAGKLQDLGPFQPEGPQPNQVEPWKDAAKENQPVLNQAREQLQVAREQVEIARRAYWPTLNLNAGYGYTKGNFLPSVESRQAQVGLNLSAPIYEGGEIRARTHQAGAQARASRHSLEALQDQVNLDTESAFLNLQDSVAQLQAAGQAMDSARVSMEATRTGYEIGARSIIDLLTTIQIYNSNQRNYYLALYTQVVARVQLKAAAGVVSGKDLEAINGLLKPAAGGIDPSLAESADSSSLRSSE